MHRRIDAGGFELVLDVLLDLRRGLVGIDGNEDLRADRLRDGRGDREHESGEGSCENGTAFEKLIFGSMRRLARVAAIGRSWLRVLSPSAARSSVQGSATAHLLGGE